ncbi:hypothetical protein QAD02_015967 [Eretmocerus hayati]|uniref:Uncharacterized protein n=1 Tax=Eretmocerus hayati TaxID=131215 RepID=A0ACC2P9U4_9HYME|nr:hypothetical protein QAD02_015967 [Eretmocerus hayati]
MEVDRVSQRNSQHSNSNPNSDDSALLERGIRESMIKTILAVFSTFKDGIQEEYIQQLLESLVCRFNNLDHILAPQLTNRYVTKDVQRQYTAFTTWLFGAMFYLISVPVSFGSFKRVIDIQTCMVRILSRQNLEIHQIITAEYLDVLNELNSFNKKTTDTHKIQLIKFQADQNAIDYLQLQSFPITVSIEEISKFQSSVLKIIIESDVSVWPRKRLENQLLETLVLSEPSVKLAALQICVQMFHRHLLTDDGVQSVIMYTSEIVNSLSKWTEKKYISTKFCRDQAPTLKHLLSLIDDPLHMNLYMEIFSLLANRILESPDLELEICRKMELDLRKFPRPYSHAEIQTLVSYFRKFQHFLRIPISFIFHEVENNTLNVTSGDMTQISKLWAALKDDFLKCLETEEYKEALNFLQLTKILDLQLSLKNISLHLLGSDFREMKSQLFKTLSSEQNLSAHRNCERNKLVFEMFTHLIALREANKSEIQKILMMPWLNNIDISEGITNFHLANAKALDSATKVKCINAISRYGKGAQRLEILKMCASHCDIELAIASVSNCPMLLLDNKIQLKHIMESILLPAYVSQKPGLYEVIADVIGQLVCLASGNGKVVRDPSDVEKFIVECSCCDTLHNKDRSVQKYVPARYDIFFNQLFELLNSDLRKVRLNMSSNLIRLSNHVRSFNSNSIAQKWMLYVEDEDEAIRTNFGKAIGHILDNRAAASIPNKNCQDDIPADLTELIKMILDKFVAVLNKALENSNQSLHETVILTAKNAACVQTHLTERRCLNIFILTILNIKSSSLAVALATNAYAEVANYKKVSLQDLYIRYKRDFLKLMMALAVHNRINYDLNLATTIHRVAICIGFEGSRQLLRKDGRYAISFLIPQVVNYRKAIVLFSDMAELLNADEKEMFKSYFKHICCRVLLFETVETGAKIFKLVSQITETSIPDLTAGSFTLIINELMLHFHSQKDKVLKHLQFLSKYDDQSRCSFRSVSETAQYLNSNSMLHGILVNFDANLGPCCEEVIQQYALASLAELIRFMGPDHITPYKYKILATLRTALTFTRPGFKKLACDAWDAFLRNTFIKDLGPLLSTICISLNPLLEAYPNECNEMLKYLLISNYELIHEYVSDLFFIKNLKVSSEISSKVIGHINKMKPKTVEEELKSWITRIRHQTDEVRLKALSYLQKFLGDHRDGINDLILAEINVHPLIVELLDTLMAGCQDKDENICIASGDCIGELGAIEPSLLPRRIISRGDTKFIPLMNQEFACELLYELVKDYQSQKNTQSMDSFSLAIQELLKHFEISPDGSNSRLWDALPSKIQHMISPLLTSHYIPMANNDIEFTIPIYGSESGSSFETWAFNWTASMLSTIQNPTIKNVMIACRPALKRSTRILTFCIPYIVGHVVLNGSDADRRRLSTEMLAVVDTHEKSKLDRELSRNRPLRDQADVTQNNARISDEAKRVRCLQVVFSTLDYLQRWLRERSRHRDTQYDSIEKFCNGFPKLKLAQGCYQSHEYHRALIYIEEHMKSNKKSVSEPIEGALLTKIYSQLEEPDGVSGILVSQDKCPTLQQLVLAHEVSGELQDATTCYERLMQNSGPKPMFLQGMIQCYLGLDHPFTAFHIKQSILDDRPELETLICDSEPFWLLAHFGKIDSESKSNVKTNLLRDLKNCVKPDVFQIKKKLVSMLTASSRPGAYQQSYSYIMKLHIVNEFEKACTKMLEDLENLPTIFDEWEKRDKFINASRGAEFILGMRRAILDLAVQLQSNVDTEKIVLTEQIGKLWLKSAKIARKAGLYQQAYMYILSATDSCPPQILCTEQAQLYWQKGCHEDALITLRRSFTSLFKPSSEYKKIPQHTFTIERKQFAKAKLLWAKYNDETLNVDAAGNTANYKEAFEVWKSWEKSWLAMARYYETLIDKMTEEERMSEKGREIQVLIVNYYGRALMNGCKYIHQTLPRMLTVWLNYASAARSYVGAADNVVKLNLNQMTKIVEVFTSKVPVFTLLTAFSQLVSRICHPNRDVKNALFAIIVRLIKEYPQHCLWMMASVFNSSYAARQKSCQEILSNDALKTPEMTRLIQYFHQIWEKLIELSNKHIPEALQTTTVTVLSKNLPKLLSHPNFGPIMMPSSKFMQLHLPSKGIAVDNHNPFPTNWVKIVGIEDEVAVMQSLQRPRRIALRGSDGKSYLFMCKPKDDLRRDFRLMEFNDIVNKYLQKDPESRRRRLYIRTYGVVPLNEECGLVEWVSNLIGYRMILMNIYKERKISTGQKEIRSMTCAPKDTLEKKRDVFLNKLLPRHPPVLGDWFRYAFPDPYGWYEARTAYIRTAAVMSMVGYILGLGDRHGENILIDSKSGDCVHVDFNCLFNKGETLDVPEMVPFRLTHNMVEAMGPLRYEGPFRQSCQTAMKVLREQSSTLISILKPFVYDPLVTWNNRNQNSEAGEKTNDKAVEHIKRIEERLKGMVAGGPKVKKREIMSAPLYLSVEGQVNHLILDAINVDYLCQMYIGWGPYL